MENVLDECEDLEQTKILEEKPFKKWPGPLDVWLAFVAGVALGYLIHWSRHP